MADDHSILTNPGPQMAPHVRDYSRFLQMMKWGAIVSFVLGLIIMAFVL